MTQMETTSERRTYGEWFDEAMLERAKRDGIDIAKVRRAVIAQRHYAVRCYYYTSPLIEFDGQQQREVDGVVTYSMRRDGRIGKSWVTLGAACILESLPMETTNA